MGPLSHVPCARHRSGAVGIVCCADGSDRPSRRRRVLRERRAAAPPGAARAAGDRVRQRPARGRHDGVLRGAPLRHRLGDADGAGAAALSRRGARRAGLRRLPRGVARGHGARRAAPSSASRSSGSTRRTSTSPTLVAPRAAMRRLVTDIHAATGLDCSIGIGPNRLVAKVASDAEKPRGFVCLTREEACERFAGHPPGLVPGIGPKTAARLEEMGITTLRALAATPVEALVARFGANHGPDLQRRARFEALGAADARADRGLGVARDDVRLRHRRRREARGDPRRPRAPALRAARQAGPAGAQRRDQGAPVGLHDRHAGAHDRRGDERPRAS